MSDHNTPIPFNHPTEIPRPAFVGGFCQNLIEYGNALRQWVNTLSFTELEARRKTIQLLMKKYEGERTGDSPAISSLLEMERRMVTDAMKDITKENLTDVSDVSKQ